MKELEPAVQKFLIANRLIFLAMFLLAMVTASVRGEMGATLVALADPYNTTLDFAPTTVIEKSDELTDMEILAEESLNVPVAGDVTPEEVTEVSKEEPVATENTVIESAPARNYSNHNVSTKTATATEAVTVKTSTAAATTTTTNYDGYYVDDNGVTVDSSYVDNTPRYNLNPAVEEPEPVVEENPVVDEPAEDE